ncbi:TVP38/TMEM64 family protein [Negadavirga shengliensis]|uniref:TVP38/TMEM64 family membrane protein n=1 Tax=Negadavirga shengliensis TaxID=1389218 RepID=A0ABV9SV15_9BACT
MNKKPSIFKRFKQIYSENPSIFWAIVWVSLMPSIGSLIVLQWFYSKGNDFILFDLEHPLSLVLYITGSTLLMGFALLPTTFLSVLSGFMFGWSSLPYLIVGYTLASIIGYSLGTKMGHNSLEILLQQYPKAADLIRHKRKRMGWLVAFVRLSPVIPFALSNILFALLKAGLKNVIWAGLWGMLPRTILAFFTGIVADSLYQALKRKEENWQLLLIGLLFLLSAWGIYRFFTNGSSSAYRKSS